MQGFIEHIGRAVDPLVVALAQSVAQVSHSSNDLFPVGTTEHIVLIPEVLASMPEKQPAVFDVAWREHDLQNDE
jgi:hypothetical protein